MGVLREDDVGPDGVVMVVDWDLMKVGNSIFIPCINVKLAIKQVTKIFDRRGWKLRAKVCIEHHILGLRIWRTA
jgi:hypothetical protein